uniref:Uncharacterized protein n=1 Tax=Anguilla anguilla TaxID=7936 RepID=A0A0E9SLH3_ANGAN
MSHVAIDRPKPHKLSLLVTIL